MADRQLLVLRQCTIEGNLEEAWDGSGYYSGEESHRIALIEGIIETCQRRVVFRRGENVDY